MDSTGSRGARVTRGLLVATFYLLVTILLTWPAITTLGSRLVAPVGPGDPYLNLWILGWDLRVLFSDPVAFVDGRVFDAPIFHPAPQTLTYSDHFLPQALLLAPLYALSGQHLVLCYNVLWLGSLWASALAMYLFARSVTGSTSGALLAGLIWGFWPYHFSHLIHLALQGTYLLPLVFLFLHRLMAGRRWRDAFGLGLVAGLNAAVSAYYGVIGAVGLAAAATALLIGIGARRRSALLIRAVGAAVVAVIVVAPVVWPYWQAQQREGFGRVLVEASRHAATPASYVSVPSTNLPYGATSLLPEARSVEGGLFLGFVAVVLALVGAWRGWRGEAKPLVWAMLALIVVGFGLSLGPDGLRAIYAAMHRWVFGFQAVRAPARFAVLVAFGVAVLAALGLNAVADMSRAFVRSRFASTSSPRKARAGATSAVAVSATASVLTMAPVLLIGLTLGEYLNRPLRLAAAPPQRTETGQWLRRAEGAGAVVYLPLARDLDNTPFMLQTLEHGRPIVNGYSGQRPAFYSAVADAMAGFPSADALWTLDEMRVRFVVTNRAVDQAAWPLIERAQVSDPTLGAETRIYELRSTDELEARLGPAAAPVPPPPGPVPFALGEQAAYRVLWSGAGASVAAGHVTTEVRPGESEGPTAGVRSLLDEARYRFVVTARTAPWVARFFEAHDTLATWTDARLLPLVSEQNLREGRRRVDRLAHYDEEARTVTMLEPREGGVERALSFRVPEAVRDPIALFFYARSLDLAPGARVQAPVNDMGRTMIVEIVATAIEPITWRGQQVDALRLDVSLEQRVETRQPLEIRVWLSRDARRLPLVAEVKAGFGAVRLELEAYQAGG